MGPMHRDSKTLNDQMSQIMAAPKDGGVVDLIVARPESDERQILETAELDVDDGLIGDNWKARGNRHTPDGRANKETQLTLMNSRVANAITDTKSEWALAGDQIYIDMDLSVQNLPAGTHLRVGTATIRISEQPHTGCKKFVERFGADALRFVNTGPGAEARFRGLNAQIIESGTVRHGDKVIRIGAS